MEDSGSNGDTAFGVVLDVSSAAAIGNLIQGFGAVSPVPGPVGDTTSILGGIFGNENRAAFPAVSSMVGQSGNIIGGIFSSIGHDRNISIG